MSHLIIAFDASDLSQVAGFGQAIGGGFDVLLLSGSSVPVGAANVHVAGLNSVPPAEGLAEAVQLIAGNYELISLVSSMRAKDLAARLGGLLDAAMVTDVIGVDSKTVFRRPLVAGSIIATVEAIGSPTIVTFRPSAFPGEGGANGSEASVSLNINGRTECKKEAQKSGGRPDLGQAKIVITGGRPLKDKETFEKVIGGTADALGAAVGATRAAVDSGIAANDLQVGQTGKIVAPDLYIAAGVSGSTQHMAGIKDSKVIVAINTDPDAPIFEVADFGLVMDLYQALPELQEKLKG
ncbi:MAG: FAD-binding protein [Chthonomonas sp.]|nr:FAD-binding protein [Chthonomonas sp.]